jgi:hypothetical protein
MAVFLNNGVVLTVNAVDLSDHVTAVTINRTFDELEVTAMGDSGHKFVKGLEASSITIDFLNDTACRRDSCNTTGCIRHKRNSHSKADRCSSISYQPSLHNDMSSKQPYRHFRQRFRNWNAVCNLDCIWYSSSHNLVKGEKGYGKTQGNKG